MRNLLMALLIVSCVFIVSFASGLSNIEKGIFQLEYIGRQVQAVENELRLYYMAKIEDRPDVEPTEEIKELKKLIHDLSALNLPQEIADLKPSFTNVINKLVNNCNGILKKDANTRDKEFDDFWKVVKNYNDQLGSKINEYILIPKFDEEFKSIDEDMKLFKNSSDQAIFKKAIAYIDKKDYKEAVDILNPLLKKYKNKTAEGSILVKIVDCYIAEGSPLSQDMENVEYVLGLLTNFVNRKQYSPRIGRIFLQWQTLEQSHNYGASNWSEMPNDQYNKVLWGLVEATEKHIERNPDDALAKVQILLLMDTPMIQRWGRGYPYGNTVAVDHAYLSGMLEKK